MNKLMVSIRDALLEFRIRQASRSDLTKPDNWHRFCRLIQMRSNTQVSRMERDRGLVK